MTPAKTRSSNIELLRILAMFMIIIFHISDHCVNCLSHISEIHSPVE